MRRGIAVVIAQIVTVACEPPADRWKDWAGSRLMMTRAAMDSLVDEEGMTVTCVARAAEMGLDADYPCLKNKRRYTKKEMDSLVNKEGMTKECVDSANKTGFNADFTCDDVN